MLFLSGVTLIACNEICYKEPQPAGVKSLNEIPAKLHGTYFFDEEDGDTVVIFKNGLRANNNKEEDVIYLSDSLVLKKYKSYYFFSHRDENEWNLRVLQIQKNGNLVMLMMRSVPKNENERKIFLENLSKETPVIETSVKNETHYIIDPSAKKLLSLIKKDFFNEKITLVKLN